MKILVTNDDGIFTEGIAVLAEAMQAFGEVVVVAPDRQRSACGHSLSLHRPLRIEERGPNRFAVDGTPTDCVNLAILEIFAGQLPDLVVSGINLGANLGDDVTYSGTVGAAMEGTIKGIPSIAFSLVLSDNQKPNFTSSARFASRLVSDLAKRKLPPATLLNVNVPNGADSADIDFEITRLGSKRFDGAVEKRIDPRGDNYYWIGGNHLPFDTREGTDSNAISRGKISLTPIALDMTDHSFLASMHGWMR